MLTSIPDDRSPSYDELLAAEETAQKEGKGMWASKPPAAKIVQDYSESLQKAKIHCSVLQRQKRVPAVVDFVKSGSRFTILIPRENAKLTFVLSGIRAPRSARNPAEKSDAFGQEAHDFVTRRCMQRDVEIDVENTDKMGGFIGILYVNRENFAKLLLEEGFASVHAYSAEQSGNATELRAAEQKAKDARKGIWHDYDPNSVDSANESSSKPPSPPNGPSSSSAPPTDNNSSSKAKPDYRDVLITHVEPTGALKMQIISPTTTTALTNLMNDFRTFHLSSSQTTVSTPKSGDLVAAQFSEDSEWYRARIRRIDRDARRADVIFLDYGNAESLPWSSLRPLSQPQFNLQTLRPQAVDAQLSFCQMPRAAGYLAEAVGYLNKVVVNRQLVARVDNNHNRRSGDHDAPLFVTLFEPEGEEEDSVNAGLVAEGLAMAGGMTGGKVGGGVSIAGGGESSSAGGKGSGGSSTAGGKGSGGSSSAGGKTSGAKKSGQDDDGGKTTTQNKAEMVMRAKEASARKERLGMWEYGDLTED